MSNAIRTGLMILSIVASASVSAGQAYGSSLSARREAVFLSDSRAGTSFMCPAP